MLQSVWNSYKNGLMLYEEQHILEIKRNISNFRLVAFVGGYLLRFSRTLAPPHVLQVQHYL